MLPHSTEQFSEFSLIFATCKCNYVFFSKHLSPAKLYCDKLILNYLDQAQCPTCPRKLITLTAATNA